MSDEVWMTPPTPNRLTGAEPIKGTNATVLDFWAWAMSNLRSNTVRAILAEYLVAHAVGGHNRLRIDWDAYDVLSSSGVPIEVKAGAYLQAWPQRRLSKIDFTGLQGRTWTPESNYAKDASYNAQVYVFAVLSVTDHAAYDALDTRQWQFWVLSVSELQSTIRKGIGLPAVQRLGGAPVAYDQLAEAIARSHLKSQPKPAS